MFIEDVDARLDELESTIILSNDSSFDLEEKMESDNAKVRLILQNPAILFKCANNNNNIKYFKNKKCADFILFEQSSLVSSKWRLHIFEFKRTVRHNSDSRPEKIINQYLGAYLNALCLAGYLNIQIDSLVLYTCYKFDNITGGNSNSAALRLAAHNPNSGIGEHIILWEKGNISLKTSFNELQCIHKRIQLNDDFHKEYAI